MPVLQQSPPVLVFRRVTAAQISGRGCRALATSRCVPRVWGPVGKMREPRCGPSVLPVGPVYVLHISVKKNPAVRLLSRLSQVATWFVSKVRTCIYIYTYIEHRSKPLVPAKFREIWGWPLLVLVLSSTCQLIMSTPYVPKSSLGFVGYSHIYTYIYIYIHMYIYILCIYTYIYIYMELAASCKHHGPPSPSR